MRSEIANVVYRVVDYGLDVKKRLEEDGTRLDLDREQAHLRGLLLTEAAARRWADFGGDSGMEGSVGAGSVRSIVDAGRRSGDGFLGIRYALTCWLDEIMIDCTRSDWVQKWQAKALENDLYQTRDRAWKFWEQARKAETLKGSDALEVFFLCVMLGFRGEMRDQPDKLRSSVKVMQTRLAQSQDREWQPPPGQDPATNVPPLRGWDKRQRMVTSWAISLLIGIFALTFSFLRIIWAKV
jgi:type VI secretion system protein ImpK